MSTIGVCPICQIITNFANDNKIMRLNDGKSPSAAARRKTSRNTAMPPSSTPQATIPSPVRTWPRYSDGACKHRKKPFVKERFIECYAAKGLFLYVVSLQGMIYSFSMSSTDIPVTFVMVSNGSPRFFIALAFFIFSSRAPFFIPFSSAVSRTFFMSR